MKPIQFNTLSRKSLLFLGVCCCLLALTSFDSKTGGESFSIYLDEKLVIQEHVTRNATLKNILLTDQMTRSVLGIYYNHCGKTGTSRTLEIRDANNRVLKAWHYPDAPGAMEGTMTCRVKEILDLRKGNYPILQLVYSSKELSGAKVLATLSGPDDKASLE